MTANVDNNIEAKSTTSSTNNQNTQTTNVSQPKIGTAVTATNTMVSEPVKVTQPAIADPIKIEAPQATQESDQIFNTAMERLKGTDRYSNLISQGKTEQEIGAELRNQINQRIQPKPQAIDQGIQPQLEQTIIDKEAQKFGYETTVEERQQRNSNIAKNLYETERQFDESKMFDEIKTLAPDVTDEEIAQTVKDIRDKYNLFERTDQLRALDNGVILQNITEGIITVNDLDGLKISDPQKYAEIQAGLQKIQDDIKIQNTYDTMAGMYGDDRIETSLEYLDQVNDKYQEALGQADGEESLKEYKDALNDPELLEQRDKLTQKEGEIKQLDLQLNDLKREVEEEFQGAPKHLINAVVADRGADLMRQKNSLLIESQTLSQQVNNKMQNAQNNYQLSLEQEKLERDNILQAYNMDMQSYEKSRAMLNRQLDFEEKDFWRKKGLEDQMAMMQVQDDMKKDFARFSMKLEQDNGGGNYKYMTDSNGNIRIFDGANQVGYHGVNDVEGGAGTQDLQDTVWYKGGSTRLNEKDPDRDIAVGAGQDLVSPVTGVIENVGTDGAGGVFVKLRTNDGNLMTIRHLDERTIDEFSDRIGSTVNPGDKIGYTGNSGYVMTKVGGNRVTLRDSRGNVTQATFSNGKTAEQMLAEGRGSHLDIRMETVDGKEYNGVEIRDYILSGKAQEDQSELQQLQREADLTRIKRGNITNTQLAEVQERAVNEGRVEDFIIAQKQGLDVDLTDEQRNLYSQEKQRFNSDPTVRAFEEAMIQYGSLRAGLDSGTGPGDMTTVFTFMKTLDPASVVRDTEFDTAAQSLGITNNFKNFFNPDGQLKGRRFTDQEAEQFGKIAKELINIKAVSYQRKYNDLANTFDSFNISNTLLPTNALDQLNSMETGTSSSPESISQGTERDLRYSSGNTAGPIENPQASDDLSYIDLP